jgi:hypothetical protein
MARSAAGTPEEYLAELPPERREALNAVRQVIRQHLPPGFEEGMEFGVISYHVPLSRFPETHNGRPLGLAALASQKNHMAVYLNTVYGDPATERWFRDRYAATGKKLDMGKSCVRFRRLEDLPLDVIGEVIGRVDLERYVAHYQAVRETSAKRKAG